MSKLKVYESFGERFSPSKKLGAVALGIFLVFSPIMGTVAMADYEAGMAAVKADDLKITEEQAALLQFLTHFDEYYNQLNETGKLPKNIMALLKKYDSMQIQQVKFEEIFMELHGQIVDDFAKFKRAGFDYKTYADKFLDDPNDINYANEIKEKVKEVVEKLDKKLAMELFRNIIERFQDDQRWRYGEYGFRNALRESLQVITDIETIYTWYKDEEYLELSNAAKSCVANPMRQRIAIDEMRHKLGYISDKDYVEPQMNVYVSTPEELAEKAKRALEPVETATPEPEVTITPDSEVTNTPEPEVTEKPIKK